MRRRVARMRDHVPALRDHVAEMNEGAGNMQERVPGMRDHVRRYARSRPLRRTIPLRIRMIPSTGARHPVAAMHDHVPQHV